MIAIVDYGLGNLASVDNALTKLGIPHIISSELPELSRADGLIVPGVGAAGEGMKQLRKRNLTTFLSDSMEMWQPMLGICLGMQLLFTKSEEGNTPCLNLISGTVKKFLTNLKIPQMGWNQIKFQISNFKFQNNNSKFKNMFHAIPDNSYFYFVHSYYCDPEDKTVIAGTTDYDGAFCSVLVKNNIYGVQFHPEKSGEVGLQLLKNFYSMCS